MAVGIHCADHVTPRYPQKLALTSLIGSGRSVGIVRSWTKGTEFSLVYEWMDGEEQMWRNLMQPLKNNIPFAKKSLGCYRNHFNLVSLSNLHL
jgi:hypothetical protein